MASAVAFLFVGFSFDVFAVVASLSLTTFFVYYFLDLVLVVCGFASQLFLSAFRHMTLERGEDLCFSGVEIDEKT